MATRTRRSRRAAGANNWASAGILMVLSLALSAFVWMRQPAPAPHSVNGDATRRPAVTWSSDQFLCLVAFDVSDSVTFEERRRLVNAFKAAYHRAFPSGTRVILYSFARKSWKHYDGSPRQWKGLWPVLDQRVLHAPSVPPGTSPSEVLGEIAAVAREADANGVRICLIEATDGEDNDATATRQRLREISGLHNVVAAWVVGADSDPRIAQNLRKLVESTHADLGRRLVVSGNSDVEAGLNRFAQLINGKEL